MILYVDTSAVGSIYLTDEADGPWIGELLFRGPDTVATCELTNVELASLLGRARRNGRLDDVGVSERWAAYEMHTAADGLIGVLPLTADTLVHARSFVLQTSIRSLDAIHLAAARILADRGGDEVAILTRDSRQGQAAADLGFNLHPRSAR